MGREIKRVAAGFDWPIGKVWNGFVNPFHVRQCPKCQGMGTSPEAQRMCDEWYGKAPFDPASTGSKPHTSSHPTIQAMARRNILYDFRTGETRQELPWDEYGIEQGAQRLATQCFDSHWSHHLSKEDVQALVDADRLWEFTRKWTKEKGWGRRKPKKTRTPSAKEVNEWSLQGLGHDSCNQWACVRARCKREGVISTCPICGGDGMDPTDLETAAKSEAWKESPPSAGEWWQLWETVSEGSPLTPAFATADELVNYLATSGDAWDQSRGDGGWGLERARAFVGVGWVPSGMTIDGKFHVARDIALANEREVAHV